MSIDPQVKFEPKGRAEIYCCIVCDDVVGYLVSREDYYLFFIQCCSTLRLSCAVVCPCGKEDF